jgi:ubiquinone/menaquinone biosynthesis C-methylase UbiE
MKQAILTNSSQVYGGEAVFKSHEEQIARARAFTYGMHGHSMGAAQAWPEVIDLSRHTLMLDIGGGSGAHAIGAVQRWPQLHATVYDLPSVCQIAEEFATQYGVQDRVTAYSGDMWHDSFPPADLHFYADIYHDWPPEKGHVLTQKSFESLPPGGRIIIHEMLYNDQKTGPFTAAAYSDAMLLWTEGQQYSGNEIASMLKEAGFTDIEIQPTFGYWSILMGRKP